MSDESTKTNEEDVQRVRERSRAEEQRKPDGAKQRHVLDSAAEIASDRHGDAVFAEASRRQEENLARSPEGDASGDLAAKVRETFDGQHQAFFWCPVSLRCAWSCS